MTRAKTVGALTAYEKTIIKGLLKAGERSQDVHALVQLGRPNTFNFGRLTAIKRDPAIKAASDAELQLYRTKKRQFDHVTGLCAIDDERLVRAREAMILAVEVFNTPRVRFKAGMFAVQSNIAWTYLLHEFYLRKKEEIINKDGWSLSLSHMLSRADCPLPSAVRKNLSAVKAIRDVVEHHLIGQFDQKWMPLFQANCLNFEKYLTTLFGARLTLGNDFGLALQFSRMSMGELGKLQEHELPPHISALDARLGSDLSEEEAGDLEYQFRVVYTLQSSSKGSAHFQFVQPESSQGKEIHNVLTKYIVADTMYPFKPMQVQEAVKASLPQSKDFTSDKHTRAWKLFGVRPPARSAKPNETQRRYCIYHPTHKDYTYSQAWVDLLIKTFENDDDWNELCSFRGNKPKRSVPAE